MQRYYLKSSFYEVRDRDDRHFRRKVKDIQFDEDFTLVRDFIVSQVLRGER